MSHTSKKLIRWNFLVSLAVAFFGCIYLSYYTHVHYKEISLTTNPFPYRVEGRSVALALYELFMLYVYFQNPAVARMIAGFIGFFGLVLGVIMPILLADLYGFQIFTTSHFVQWYVAGSHMIYGFFGRDEYYWPD